MDLSRIYIVPYGGLNKIVKHYVEITGGIHPSVPLTPVLKVEEIPFENLADALTELKAVNVKYDEVLNLTCFANIYTENNKDFKAIIIALEA